MPFLTENEQVRGEVISAHGAHQSIYSGGKGYSEGAEGARVKDTPGAGEASV